MHCSHFLRLLHVGLLMILLLFVPAISSGQAGADGQDTLSVDGNPGTSGHDSARVGEDPVAGRKDTVLPVEESKEVLRGGTVTPTKPTKESTSLLKKPDIQWPITPSKIIWSIIIFVATFLAIRFVTRILEALAERWTHMRLLLKRLVSVIRILIWTSTMFVIIAGILRPPIETLIALTASVGIAVGFASQDILKNIFGGVMILLDRPFQVGDKIEVGGHYGEVVQIGLRTVRIVTPDDNLVSIPNGEIMYQAVSNANAGESNCQVVAEFFLPPDIDTMTAKKVAYRAAAVSRYVYLNKPIAVIMKNEIHQGRSLFKMRLKAYVMDIRYEFLFASEMTEIVMREFLRKGLVTPEELAVVTKS